jgi:quinol monooxygenase YgiN
MKHFYLCIVFTASQNFSHPKIKEAFMFVRLTFCKFLPEKVNEARKIFISEIMPTVRKQKGVLNIRLLEPTEKAGDYISITEWKTKADAEQYEISGLYKKLVNRLEPFFTKQPELKTYIAEEVFEHA